jgi:hypothetical protein
VSGVYVVIEFYDPDDANVSGLEVLSDMPKWVDPESEHFDEVCLQQDVYVANVNGGDSQLVWNHRDDEQTAPAWAKAEERRLK